MPTASFFRRRSKKHEALHTVRRRGRSAISVAGARSVFDVHPQWEWAQAQRPRTFIDARSMSLLSAAVELLRDARRVHSAVDTHRVHGARAAFTGLWTRAPRSRGCEHVTKTGHGDSTKLLKYCVVRYWFGCVMAPQSAVPFRRELHCVMAHAVRLCVQRAVHPPTVTRVRVFSHAVDNG